MRLRFTPCFNTTSGTGFFLDLEAATDVTIEVFPPCRRGRNPRCGIVLSSRWFCGYETDAAAWTLAGSASGFDPVSAISMSHSGDTAANHLQRLYPGRRALRFLPRQHERFRFL